MLRNILVSMVVALMATEIAAQDTNWQQEYQASINGKSTCAYSGGFDYAKPVLVDIDADGDLDLFVGERDDGVDFIRNVGNGSDPSWSFVDKSFVPLSGYFFAPAFCDIDADGDLDAFIGGWNGKIRFFQNDGDSTSPSWTLVTGEFDSINVGYHSTPAFCDIDADGDFDLFIGTSNGNVNFYRNEGTPQSDSFVLVDTAYVLAYAGNMCVPTFTDIDDDHDFDLFIGVNYSIYFYRNDGDSISAVWTLDATAYGDIQADGESALAFGDLDGDGDLDMLVGEAFLGIRFYRNTGNSANATWELITKYYATIDIGYPCYPTLADIDADGDFDLFAGRYEAGLYRFANNGTANEPAWLFSDDKYTSDGNIPSFCDIDGDGDPDLFCGKIDGTLLFYGNQGTPDSAIWAPVVQNYNSIDVGEYCSPAFCDIDEDSDFDLFVGKEDGMLSFYENTGDSTSPSWAAPDTFYAAIDIGAIRSMPAFCDIDEDGDFDLFIGGYNGKIAFYRNEGNSSSPSFALVTTEYASIQLVNQTRPVFVDIDADGDQDLFVGDADGGINFWRNMERVGYEEGKTILSIPTVLVLHQNQPNPFALMTTISYQLRLQGNVSLRVYSLTGQLVRALVDAEQTPGSYNVSWDGSDDTERQVPSGVYFYRLNAGDYSATRKIVVIH